MDTKQTAGDTHMRAIGSRAIAAKNAAARNAGPTTTTDLETAFTQAITNAAASGTVSPDKLAEMELIREYFTNPTFKTAIEAHIFEMVG